MDNNNNKEISKPELGNRFWVKGSTHSWGSLTVVGFDMERVVCRHATEPISYITVTLKELEEGYVLKD